MKLWNLTLLVLPEYGHNTGDPAFGLPMKTDLKNAFNGSAERNSRAFRCTDATLWICCSSGLIIVINWAVSQKNTFPYCSESPGIWDSLAPSVQATVMIKQHMVRRTHAFCARPWQRWETDNGWRVRQVRRGGQTDECERCREWKHSDKSDDSQSWA